MHFEGTVVSMESVSMSWILDEEPATTAEKTIEEKNAASASEIEVKLDAAAVIEKPSDQIEEMKENVTDIADIEMREIGEQQTINRPAHTLVNINFKIKKGERIAFAF